MEKDSFLKKFIGRTEIIGRQGILPIMNNVHINVNDSKLMNKKNNNALNQRKKSGPKNEYSYIRSEITKEFNENKNFMPQMQKLSMSLKLNPKGPKENDNNINKRRSNENIVTEINKRKIKLKFDNNIDMNSLKKEKNYENKKNSNYNINGQERKIKGDAYKNKSKEKPVKLYDYLEQNKNKKVTTIERPDGKNISKSPQKEKKMNILKINNSNGNINNRQLQVLKNNKNINSSVKLPSLSPVLTSPKSKSNNILIKSSNGKLHKSYERVNTYTPNFRNMNLNKNENGQNKNQSQKEIIPSNSKSNKLQSNSLSLPRIKMSKNISSSPKNNMRDYNDKRIIENFNKNVIINIKKDFLLLDSIKNRGNNKDKKENFSERDLPKKKINGQFIIDNDNGNNIYNNNNKNNIKIIKSDNKNVRQKENGNIYPSNNRSNFDNNKLLYDNNNNYYNRNSYNNLSENKTDVNIINNKINKNYFGTEGKKKAHTSFDIPPVLPGIKNKLDIIHEEEEDDNKYVTDININNFGNEENLNTLEILMRQRRMYQNKIPENSRFKLRQINEEQF